MVFSGVESEIEILCVSESQKILLLFLGAKTQNLECIEIVIPAIKKYLLKSICNNSLWCK